VKPLGPVGCRKSEESISPVPKTGHFRAASGFLVLDLWFWISETFKVQEVFQFEPKNRRHSSMESKRQLKIQSSGPSIDRMFLADTLGFLGLSHNLSAWIALFLLVVNPPCFYWF
jgi:hypothetical protein